MLISNAQYHPIIVTYHTVALPRPVRGIGASPVAPAVSQKQNEAGNPAICTFGNLIDSKQRCNETSHARRLDSWNARTDNLGSLLNIAVAMV